MSRCIAFHSYKGGTGKTTLAANFAASLVQKGNVVFLLDVDVYAPSLDTYFNTTPKKWLNDYLRGDANVDDIYVDLTHKLQINNGGKLCVGFSSGKKEDIYSLDPGTSKKGQSQLQYLRNFILLREELMMKKNADYVILDTSPGIRYWSINSLAISDLVLLTLKMGDLDIEGTQRMAKNIYESFTKFGTSCFLLLNRVSGYCTVPASQEDHINTIRTNNDNKGKNQDEHIGLQIEAPETDDVGKMLSKSINMDVISQIPCYCDIQFNPKEFLTVINNSDHPFSTRLLDLVKKLEQES